MVFAIQWHESAMGVHVFPILNPPYHLSPNPIPQGYCSAHPWAPCLMHQTWTGNPLHIWQYICFSATNLVFLFWAIDLSQIYVRAHWWSVKGCSSLLVSCNHRDLATGWKDVWMKQTEVHLSIPGVSQKDLDPCMNFKDRFSRTARVQLRGNWDSSWATVGITVKTEICLPFTSCMHERASSWVHWHIEFQGWVVVNFIFIFNGSILTLQYYVGFYQTSTRISHRFTHVPSHMNIPPISLPIPPF